MLPEAIDDRDESLERVREIGTCREWWMIETIGERVSGKSVLVEQDYDDDEFLLKHMTYDLSVTNSTSSQILFSWTLIVIN